MIAMTRDDALNRDAILTRYRHLRAISTQHHSAALRFLSRQAILEHARGLGLTVGKTLVADSEDELTLVFDLALHSPRNARSRAIDRYRKAARLAPDSDEAKVLDAMCRARFSIWRVERRHEAAGLVVFDILRQTDAWLVDEALEQSADAGMAIAMRLFTPEAFAMTAGVVVPVDRDIVREALAETLPRHSADPDVLASDPCFAMALYRAALNEGVMEEVSFL
jgi:hypothetical protein